jgi:hypothetical protein
MKCALRTALFFLLTFLVGCGEFIVDDKEIVENNRTQDITFDNAEELIWNAFHGAGTAFTQSEVKDGLDANFFGGQSGVQTCAGGGTINYQYSAAPGEVHEAGDTLSLNYDQCVRADSAIVNGQVTGRYTEVEGYNDAFTGFTMDQCAARVAEKESLNTLIVDQAETVIFDRQGAQLFVRYRSSRSGQGGVQVDQSVYILDEGEDAIVVNRSLSDSDSVLPADGAQIFLVKDFVQEQLDCRYYKRTLELVLSSLRVTGQEVETILNTTLTAEHYFRSSTNQDFDASSSFASVSVKKNSYEVPLELRDLQYRQEYDGSPQSTLSVAVSGEMNVAGGGIVEYLTLLPMRSGSVGAVPVSGQLRVNGIEFDQATMNIDSASLIRFSVAAEGDTTGDSRPDPEPPFASSWTDFLNRDFVRPAP